MDMVWMVNMLQHLLKNYLDVLYIIINIDNLTKFYKVFDYAKIFFEMH